jgi:hypothetical protein
MPTYNFADLDRRGFIIIPNFLNSQEINKLQQTHQALLNNLETSKLNKNYDIISGPIPNSVKVKISSALADIRMQTNLKTDLVKHWANFLDNQLLQFGWHQDHEHYYMSQNTYHNLNFWMPIIKPTGVDNGMDIIPLDQIARQAPDFYRDHVLGKGATSWFGGPNPKIQDDETGRDIPLDFDPINLKLSPILNPGDLLLLRLDVPHCSQTPTGHRVAIGVHAIYSDQIITREKFYSGCALKHQMIANNSNCFDKFHRAFKTNPSVTLKQALFDY